MKLHHLFVAALLCSLIILAKPVMAATTHYTATDDFTEQTIVGLVSTRVAAKRPANFPYSDQQFRWVASCTLDGNKYERFVDLRLHNTVEFNVASDGLYGLGATVEFKVKGKKPFVATGAIQDGRAHFMHFMTSKADGNDNNRLINYIGDATTLLIRFRMFNGDLVVVDMPIANLSQHYSALATACDK